MTTQQLREKEALGIRIEFQRRKLAIVDAAERMVMAKNHDDRNKYSNVYTEESAAIDGIINRILAELEAAKKDAARYRYCKAGGMFKSDDPDSWIDAALNPTREDMK
jgi:hypothetical protein